MLRLAAAYRISNVRLMATMRSRSKKGEAGLCCAQPCGRPRPIVIMVLPTVFNRSLICSLTPGSMSTATRNCIGRSRWRLQSNCVNCNRQGSETIHHNSSSWKAEPHANSRDFREKQVEQSSCRRCWTIAARKHRADAKSGWQHRNRAWHREWTLLPESAASPKCLPPLQRTKCSGFFVMISSYIHGSGARRRNSLAAWCVAFIVVAVLAHQTCWGETQRVAVSPGRATQVVNLRDRLVVGLQARLKSEVAFVELVVAKVRTGKLPQHVVDETFFWARDRASIQRNGNSRRPIIFFQPAMKARAKRLRVAL